MDKELEDLRRQLAESKEEFERLRVEEQVRLAEELRRLEAAEAYSKQSQPKSLIDYLRACHNFSLSLQVVTDETLTTKGDTTKPTSRPYPWRINCWEDLSISLSFTSQQVFPSSHQLEYVQKYLDPISSELGLRHHTRDTVENPIRTVTERLQLSGTIMFERNLNLGNTNDNPIEEDVEHMSISGSHTSKAERQKKGKGITLGNSRGVTGAADQFCIYEFAEGRRVPAVLIEYKAPHKLPLAEIIARLSREIRPAEDIINKDGDELEFLSKSLLTTVVTQLEAINFLYIPNDPTTIYDRNRLYRTTITQITTFVLNAFAAKPPRQSWHDTAACLDTWAVGYINILKKIPKTKGFTRSLIRTRAQTRHLASAYYDDVDDQVHSSSDKDNNNKDPPSLTPNKADRAIKFVHVQLANDRGRDTDYKPLFVKGLRGALVKIRLTSHEYTCVTKAIQVDDRQHLLNEAKLPFYYDYGRPLHLHLDRENANHVLTSILHKDPELRNWLWDEERGNIMLVDFERAGVRDWLPLNVLSPNRKMNPQGELTGVGEDDAFDREMRIARNCIARRTR
ncbi:hypothetical protein BJ875DRAFT_515281 [Amylocarpus encephaloides]|uniref:Aminoglycoside phosphotransferase domain-containing protein n=1 Tax=Amylocarpus encephaloides TaxID=45428 RepID=A0A9P7YDZ8_9HELO|nr:hypothetical protein BJ875DRAFT_515281 [Amylocarpus encephaloides]